jgi:DNA-binding CsgD family transcriptional regulator
VFTGSPTAEQRLLAAWDAHDAVLDGESGARAATSLTNWMVISGRAEEALAWAERAVGATAPDSALRAMARTGQAFAYSAAGRSHEGLAVLDFLPDSASEVALVETDALIMRGILRVYVDDLSGAIADLGVAAARLSAGLPSTYPVPCLAHLSDAHFRHGDWDAALTHAQAATSLAQDADRPLDLARAHARAAQVLAYRGSWDLAQIHVTAARAAAQRFPLVVALASSAVAGASLAFARSDLLGVLEATEHIRGTNLVEVGGCPGIFNWRAMEADALIRLSRWNDAEAALVEYAAALTQGGPPSAALALARCQGNLATARGEWTAAAEAFDRGRVLQRSLSMPFEVALLNLDDGRRLRGLGNVAETTTRLTTAQQAFTRLGAEPFVRVCADDLAALNSPVQVLPAQDTFGLSRAELAVAQLVADGLTNKEVAAKLFLSIKTVEYHLRNSYDKLAISSRRELTALLRSAH